MEENNKISSILEQSRRSHGIRKYIIIFKNKIIIVFLLILLLLGAFFIYQKFNNSNQEVNQETIATVKKDDIKITIQSDGNIIAKDGVDLSFSDVGSQIQQVYVKEGDMVKKGDKIATIETNELYIDLSSAKSSLQYAVSKLDELEAEATDTTLASYKNSVKSAEATLDKTIYQNEYSIKDAERAVETAKNNLKLAEDGDNSQIITSAYEDLLNSLVSSLNSLSGVLRDSDSILGIDDVYANDDFEDYLSVLNSSNLNSANSSYLVSKEKISKAESYIIPLISKPINSIHVEVMSGAELVKDAFVEMQQHTYNMQKMLETTPAVGDLTQSVLDGMRSSASSMRSTVISGINSLNSATEAIDTAENSYVSYTNSYNDAIQNLEKAKKDADVAEASARLSLETAENNLNEQLEPPTTSELASAKNSVASAESNVNKIWYQIQESTLTSPIDGEVVLLNGKTGDIVVDEKNQPFCTILNKDVFYVETQIEEADISQIKVGQKAYVTIDALDSSEVLGEVSFVSLISEASNGIVTYKVRILLENTNELDIREGMSVYVDFVISETNDVLTLPVQAVKSVDKKPSVVMEDGTIKNVTTGFTDGRMVEIISGLEIGEKVKY